MITGAVPDQAAVDRLTTLAIANSKTPAGVANYMTINPNVPRTVPVRVIELTSTRFPEDSAEILPDHALELDRVVTIMNALPNISVLVVGHADQRGDELGNWPSPSSGPGPSSTTSSPAGSTSHGWPPGRSEKPTC